MAIEYLNTSTLELCYQPPNFLLTILFSFFLCLCYNFSSFLSNFYQSSNLLYLYYNSLFFVLQQYFLRQKSNLSIKDKEIKNLDVVNIIPTRTLISKFDAKHTYITAKKSLNNLIISSLSFVHLSTIFNSISQKPIIFAK